MITPEYLNEVVKGTENAGAEVVEYLLAKIAKSLADGFDKYHDAKLIPSRIADVHKLMQKGWDVSEIQAEIERRIPDIQKEVRKAFYESADEIARSNNEFARIVVDLTQADIEVPAYEQVGIPQSAEQLHLTPREARQLETAYRRTNTTVKNMCRSTANSANRAYFEACDRAYFKVKNGISLNTAICEAIEEMAKQGIDTVTYGGRLEKMEVAIARAVRTGINQANADINLTRCAEMGVGFVKVSEHLGARVTPNDDYTNHSGWQGKVYKLDWNNPALADYDVRSEENKGRFKWLSEMKDFLKRLLQGKKYDYPDFVTECGYGEMLGICGINCRHTFSPFYPDVMEDKGSQIDKKENEKRYRETQTQRSMERNIRKTKRALRALKECGSDSPEIKQRIRELRKTLKEQSDRYMDYCKQHRLTPTNWRLQV